MSYNPTRIAVIASVCMILVNPTIVSATPPPVELGNTPAETGATKVMAAIDSNDGYLVDLKTGETVVLPPVDQRVTVPAGEVFWHPKRDWIDELGFRHIHFQQRLGLSGPISTLLTDHYLAEGVPLAGGSLKMHYDAEGVLYFVSGAYFDNPQPYGSLQVQTPLAAISRAWWLLENIAGFEMGDLRALAPEILEELLEFTELKLVSAGDGRTFSLIWEAPGLLADGGSMMVALNAGTEELIHFWDPNPHQSPGWGTGPCLPQSSIGTSATAEPQRYPTIPMRSGLAATPSTATPGYTHEAFWPETSGAQVQILGYRGTGSDACDFIGDQLYEIVPLPTDNQLPHYGPIPPDYDPQIVGDAVWKTQLTMEFFDDLGWDGWNDQGASAKIVVEGECMPGNAMFIHNNTENAPFGPNNSVLICSKDASEQDFSSAASLDVVAHEWGHGVVFTAVDWDMSNLTEAQFHEGWADIIGHGAEWHKESAGNGYENAEWNYDEDSRELGGYARKVNLDDGELINNTHPVEDENQYCYYSTDPCGGDYGHYGGMKLAVAFWLAADGTTDDGTVEHKNPVCRRDPDDRPSEVDCNLTVTELGHWPATRIFFRVLTVYANDNDDWNSFAEYAKHSAYDLYATNYPGCTNAYDEQDTVQDAFSAIGYPGPTPSHRYCQLCGCPD